jgi:sec-independent protein translocase protein TatC
VTVTEESKKHLREMGLFDHLEELRSGLIASFVAWFASSVVIWFFSAQILDFLIRNLPVKNLYFYSPVEAFMIRMKLSFVLGILLSFPYILFRVWSFISPGLFKRENRFAPRRVMRRSLLSRPRIRLLGDDAARP